MGTPAYMAPEQASGEVDRQDERSDVYALGAILYFLLTDVPPFQSSEARQHRQAGSFEAPRRPRLLNPKIDKAIEAICIKAMSHNQVERYSGAQQLAADIGLFLDGKPVSAYRENIVERIDRWITRNRFLVFLILAYLLMRIFVLIAFGR
jgi:serine/threonine protein kinase